MIPVVSGNNTCEQPICGPSTVGTPRIAGCIAVSERIPVSWTISWTLSPKVTPCWAWTGSRRRRREHSGRPQQVKRSRVDIIGVIIAGIIIGLLGKFFAPGDRSPRG